MFVAGFIGAPQMNFIAATVTGRTEAGGVRLNVASLGLSEITLSPRNIGSRFPDHVLIGVRPEHFRPAAATDEIQIRLIPDVIEHLGGVAYVYTNAGRDNALTSEIRGVQNLRVGQELHLSIRPEDCFLFEEGGTRL
jgi:multiple sugar transport system ATP-binding protein